MQATMLRPGGGVVLTKEFVQATVLSKLDELLTKFKAYPGVEVYADLTAWMMAHQALFWWPKQQTDHGLSAEWPDGLLVSLTDRRREEWPNVILVSFTGLNIAQARAS